MGTWTNAIPSGWENGRFLLRHFTGQLYAYCTVTNIVANVNQIKLINRYVLDRVGSSIALGFYLRCECCTSVVRPTLQ